MRFFAIFGHYIYALFIHTNVLCQNMHYMVCLLFNSLSLSLSLLLCVKGKVDEMAREKEQLNLQIAEMSILARIKQEEGEAELSPQGGEEGERERERQTARDRVNHKQANKGMEYRCVWLCVEDVC